jgi:hypothetical protein
MDALKRLFGGDEAAADAWRAQSRAREISNDQRAVERYRYLLRTAAPETIAAAHAEAFAQLSSDQRRLVLQELTRTVARAERTAGVDHDAKPASLARLATRAEMPQRGTLERTWSAMPGMPGAGGMGPGGLMMGNFLGTFAGVMLGNMVADAFLGNSVFAQDFPADSASAHAEASGDTTDASMGDGVGVDDVGRDPGGFGDFGSDMGGFGDFDGEF